MHFECITVVRSMCFTQGEEEYFYSQIMEQLYIIIFIKCLVLLSMATQLKIGYNKNSFLTPQHNQLHLISSMFITLRPRPSTVTQVIICEHGTWG